MNYKIVYRNILPVALSLFLVSCNVQKSVSQPKKSTTKTENLRTLYSHFDGRMTSDTKNLLKDAEKYLGTPYKYGGSTASGMDCSGFTCTVFSENSYKLPRSSVEQAEVGNTINIKNVKPGDLLFFATLGGRKVSHTGIVHHIGNDGEVFFIHASTSKGVIISSLNQKYWNKTYLHAKRIL